MLVYGKLSKDKKPYFLWNKLNSKKDYVVTKNEIAARKFIFF